MNDKQAITNEEANEWLAHYQNKLIEDDKYARDVLATASPHIYGIMDKKKQPVPEGDGEFLEYYNVAGCDTYSPAEFVDKIIEDNDYSPEEFREEFEDLHVYELADIVFGEDGFVDEEKTDEHVLIEFCDAYIEGCECRGDWLKCDYEWSWFLVPDRIFMTLDEAKQHLKDNYYHYHEDAHTYCMHAWRAPETKKFLDIVMHIDFGKSDIVMRESE